MKKLLTFTAFITVTVLTTYGQGSVGFSNSGATSRVWLEQTPGGTTTWVPVGTAYTAELMFAPDGTPLDVFDAVAYRVGNMTSFGPQGGLFSGGGATVQEITPAGGFGLFQVRVWETSMGTDYRSALLNPNAHVGASVIMRIDTGDPTTVPPQTRTSLTASGLNSFVVTQVPEPSVIGLGLLGAGALLYRRRRK